MSIPLARGAATISHTALNAMVVKVKMEKVAKVRTKVASIAKTKVVSTTKVKVNTAVMIVANIAKKTTSMAKRTMIK
jgi:hypothetical protein